MSLCRFAFFSQPTRSSRSLVPAAAHTAHWSQRDGDRRALFLLLLHVVVIRLKFRVCERVAAAHSAARARARPQQVVPGASGRVGRARALERAVPRLLAAGFHERQRAQKVSDGEERRAQERAREGREAETNWPKYSSRARLSLSSVLRLFSSCPPRTARVRAQLQGSERPASRTKSDCARQLRDAAAAAVPRGSTAEPARADGAARAREALPVGAQPRSRSAGVAGQPGMRVIGEPGARDRGDSAGRHGRVGPARWHGRPGRGAAPHGTPRVRRGGARPPRPRRARAMRAHLGSRVCRGA